MDKPTVRTVGICVGHSLKTRPMNYYSVADVDAYIAHMEAKLSEAEHRLQLVRHQRDKASTGWIFCEDRLPFSEQDKWSVPVAAVSDFGEVFMLSCMGTYWQRSRAFVDSGATKIIKWMPLEDHDNV